MTTKFNAVVTKDVANANYEIKLNLDNLDAQQKSDLRNLLVDIIDKVSTGKGGTVTFWLDRQKKKKVKK